MFSNSFGQGRPRAGGIGGDRVDQIAMFLIFFRKSRSKLVTRTKSYLQLWNKAVTLPRLRDHGSEITLLLGADQIMQWLQYLDGRW